MNFPDPEIVNLSIDPVSGNPPAGVDVRYDPEFEELAAEIAKMESITATVIDWDLVSRLAVSILKAKSKDYRVASYLVLALYQTHKFAGLLNALSLYEGLIKNYWETGFPEKSRMRGRNAALVWLNDRLGTALSRDSKISAPDEQILELEKATGNFLAAVRQFYGDEAPAFTEFRQAVDARVKEVRAKIRAAEQAKEEKARRAAAVASGEVAEVEDAEKVIEDCRDKLARVALFLFKSDPSAPLAYRISRGVTWGWLVSLPANENGMTQIPPAPADAVQKCAALAEAGDWRGIVDEAESDFFNRVFGFDLQRWCIRAMGELGDQYAEPRRAILIELAGLLARLPEIIELKFNNGIAFADSQTKSWIKDEVLAAVSSSGEPKQGAETTGAQESAELAEAAAEAKRLMAKGKLQEAIGMFKDGISKSPLRKMRFLWRLELAKLCMEAGKLQLALPQLTSLDEDVGRFSLEEWEPGLSLEVVQQLYLCRQRLSAGLQVRPAELEQELAQLYQRLCKLDVNAALAVES